MLIHNLHKEGLVNGDKGIVIDFVEERENEKLPLVRFTNDQILKIKRVKWQKIEGFDNNGNAIVSCSRSQIPLILAWATTIHKSQGQSIQRLVVDLKRCWSAAQIYTALSRATDPRYLQILNFSYNQIICDSRVKNFYKKLESKETLKRI